MRDSLLLMNSFITAPIYISFDHEPLTNQDIQRHIQRSLIHEAFIPMNEFVYCDFYTYSRAHCDVRCDFYTYSFIATCIHTPEQLLYILQSSCSG